ncbi:hypothetical protein [Longimicrobium sp.]|uniref:hypothetical protein n=1 Tax=Longimicrobium sp. TaxID=2029185 RepID=UPI002E31394C|nr:hypothetical protein [Longimicrobium sp.]HEX6038894.1 hypothetical protein [Longimicrobium sp.]
MSDAEFLAWKIESLLTDRWEIGTSEDGSDSSWSPVGPGEITAAVLPLLAPLLEEQGRLRRVLDNVQFQVTYMCEEIGVVLGLGTQSPADTVSSVRDLMQGAESSKERAEAAEAEAAKFRSPHRRVRCDHDDYMCDVCKVQWPCDVARGATFGGLGGSTTGSLCPKHGVPMVQTITEHVLCAVCEQAEAAKLREERDELLVRDHAYAERENALNDGCLKLEAKVADLEARKLGYRNAAVILKNHVASRARLLRKVFDRLKDARNALASAQQRAGRMEGALREMLDLAERRLDGIWRGHLEPGVRAARAALSPAPEPAPWKCAARNSACDPPQDCDWPNCGCDPKASEVMSALVEQGWRPPAPAQEGAPKPAHLFCPKCNERHVDRGEWETRPHHKHLCEFCGHVWRVEPYTYGIAAPEPAPVSREGEPLAKALEIIEAAAENECGACADGESLWRGEDQPELYLHGFDDEMGECESQTMQAAVDAGLLPITILPKCKAGHAWYGGGCPNCARRAAGEGEP